MYFVYILSSRSGALYIGMTRDLARRIGKQRSGQNMGHASRYRIHRLVHYECCEEVLSAIGREKQLKGWRREKKIALITAHNPAWDDLSMLL
jgi:putative endonuclease